MRSASASGSGSAQSSGCTQKTASTPRVALGDIGGVALVADGQLGPIAHLGIETVRVAQQQARTHAGLTEHPRDV